MEPIDKRTFEQELERLINKHSQEQFSHTPDFILARYLAATLAVWNASITERERWYGRSPLPATIELGGMPRPGVTHPDGHRDDA